MIGASRGLVWVTAALLSLAVTAALTWSVGRLTAQRIGLSSQPVSVVNGLAPPPADASSQRPSEPAEKSPATAPTPRSDTTTGGATLPQPTGPAQGAPPTPTSAGPTSAGPAAQATAAAAPSPSPRANGGDHSDDSGGGRGQAGGGRDD